MQTRFFPASAASRFGLMGIVAALLMFSLPASAAFAQDVIAIDEGDDVQYSAVCQNIIGSIGNITQSQTGTATAVAVDEDEEVGAVGTVSGEAAEGSDTEVDAQAETDADAVAEEDEPVEQGEAVADRGVVAEVAQEQGVSIEQVNECLNGAAGTGGDDTGDNTGDDTADTGDDTADTASREADVLATTIPDQKVLANTGGPALLLPVLGLLLISSVALRNLLRR